jgi:hypothetical protein
MMFIHESHGHSKIAHKTRPSHDEKVAPNFVGNMRYAFKDLNIGEMLRLPCLPNHCFNSASFSGSRSPCHAEEWFDIPDGPIRRISHTSILPEPPLPQEKLRPLPERYACPHSKSRMGDILPAIVGIYCAVGAVAHFELG